MVRVSYIPSVSSKVYIYFFPKETMSLLFYTGFCFLLKSLELGNPNLMSTLLQIDSSKNIKMILNIGPKVFSSLNV